MDSLQAVRELLDQQSSMIDSLRKDLAKATHDKVTLEQALSQLQQDLKTLSKGSQLKDSIIHEMQGKLVNADTQAALIRRLQRERDDEKDGADRARRELEVLKACQQQMYRLTKQASLPNTTSLVE